MQYLFSVIDDTAGLATPEEDAATSSGNARGSTQPGTRFGTAWLRDK
jgi:hypothetical protein